ncbi:hypothetical protein ACU686_26615 [Yinghuangia aomiensis]
MATKTQTKIQHLQTLIDHPRTGEEERDTARRMLKRLLDKAKADGVTVARGGWVDRRGLRREVRPGTQVASSGYRETDAS